MKPIPITETECLKEIMLFGKPALFTILRVDRYSLPDGLYRYDIRHSDADWGDPATIEKNVLVNHMGAVITNYEIDLGDHGFLNIDSEKNEFYITDHFGIDPSDINNVLNYFKEVSKETKE